MESNRDCSPFEDPKNLLVTIDKRAQYSAKQGVICESAGKSNNQYSKR